MTPGPLVHAACTGGAAVAIALAAAVCAGNGVAGAETSTDQGSQTASARASTIDRPGSRAERSRGNARPFAGRRAREQSSSPQSRRHRADQDGTTLRPKRESMRLGERAYATKEVSREPDSSTPPASSPAEWTLLGWVRRSLFNKEPVVDYRSAENVQGPLGVITGSIGATDPEGDPLKYRVTVKPAHGTVVIDQATGTFTYTPDLEYAQTGGPDVFRVRVSDGKLNLLHLLRPDARARIDMTVSSILPAADRFIVPLPDTIVQPQNPSYTADGTALVFRATPVGASRSEIYRVKTDGSALQCLTCGLAPELTVNLSKPFVFDDGNRVLLSAGTQSDSGGETADHYILECAGGVNICGSGSQLLQITIPTAVPANVTVIQKQRELRIAPDGLHVGFTQLLGSGAATQLVSSVGRLERTETGYAVVDARVVYVGGELKNFTPDGKSVMITDFSGKYEAGNADNVLVDLHTGVVHRLTANLDYDESVDMSFNGQWLAVGSSRTLDYLTAMSQIVRPTFVPAYVVFPTFQAKKGSLNQAWVVSRDDELRRENGIFLGDVTGAYNSVPVANWSPDGTSIAFWERSKTDPTDTRLVIAALRNIDGGVRVDDVSTPDTASWAKPLSAVVITATPTEPSRSGKVGGSAVVSTVKNGNLTTTTVTYTNFEDEQGFVLNGTETTIANATLTNITYSADVRVTGSDGAQRGYLAANNVKIVNQLTMTGVIESSLDGRYLVMGTPA
ncbi:MAG: Ig-like domain-containing protein [Actinomycetota bacterium]